MKKTVYRVLLGLSAGLMFFRFGGPALLYGATGPGPVGRTWVDAGHEATRLLDADMRFFGALVLGIGIIMLWMMRDIERHTTLLRLIAGAVFLGGAARVYALITYGSAGGAGAIPIAIELSVPIALVWLQASITATSIGKQDH